MSKPLVTADADEIIDIEVLADDLIDIDVTERPVVIVSQDIEGDIPDFDFLVKMILM
jgi:hypothetical protein|nr:MAG TPA: hypothetical protein [Caudoviricetes sp.]